MGANNDDGDGVCVCVYVHITSTNAITFRANQLLIDCVLLASTSAACAPDVIILVFTSLFAYTNPSIFITPHSGISAPIRLDGA